MNDNTTSPSFSLKSLSTAIEPANQPTTPVATFQRKSTEDPHAPTTPKTPPLGSGFTGGPPAATFQMNPIPSGKTVGSFNFGDSNGANAPNQSMPAGRSPGSFDFGASNVPTTPKTSPLGSGFTGGPPAATFQMNPASLGKSVGSFNFGDSNGANAPNQPVPAGRSTGPFNFSDSNAPTMPKTSPFGNNFTGGPPAQIFQTNPAPSGKPAGSFNSSDSNRANAPHQPVPSFTVVRSNQRAYPVMPAEVENVQDEEKESPLSAAQQSEMTKKIYTKLRDTGGHVVDRDDPTSPLFSTKTFEELQIQPELLKGIYNMGFQKPSRIQEVLLPILLANPSRNVIAQSQSGTGKTGAFSLTILSRIDPRLKGPQAMILAPTFELALQIGSVVEQMARFLPYIQVAYAVRRTEAVRQPTLRRGELLEEPIVIGTPGTIEDWCFKKRVIDLSQLRIFCVDEADVMIDVGGFQESCKNIVQKLNLERCLITLFSATYSDSVMEFARQIVPNPRVFRLKREKQSLENIRQFFIQCYQPEEKYFAIQQIYASLNIGQTMIFCRTKATARELNVRMSNEGHSVRELTAALDIEQRASVIKAFRDGLFRVLISTNVTSRGIDIDDVSLVINYDMPIDTKYNADHETYLHRIGRCGRFGRMGYTFNLIGSKRDLDVLRDIENYFQRQMEEIKIEQIPALAADFEE